MTVNDQRKRESVPLSGRDPLVRRVVSRLRPRGPLGWVRRAAATGIVGMILLGLYQGLVATTPALRVTVTVAQAPVMAVDVWRSTSTSSVRLTIVAPVVVDPIVVNGVRQGPTQRILYDAPATAVVGDRVPVAISLDGRQVRTGSLPGPAVLPGPQGGTLMFFVGLWLVLVATMRIRTRRSGGA